MQDKELKMVGKQCYECTYTVGDLAIGGVVSGSSHIM